MKISTYSFRCVVSWFFNLQSGGGSYLFYFKMPFKKSDLDLGDVRSMRSIVDFEMLKIAHSASG